MSEDVYRERAESCEARLATLQDSLKPALERVKQFKANFGIREMDTGEIDIDYEKFVANLGRENALALKDVIDEQYGKSQEKAVKA